MMALVCQGNVLADEHTDTDTGHVKAIEERLDGAVNLHALATALVFEDTLGHGGDDAIMTALDLVQGLSETRHLIEAIWKLVEFLHAMS
ncbi:hypothetical protein HG531_000225 [Fusarium graminearum]|nr:hypothetical protein HG531_000225 [Fusarium graminearum]